MECITKLISIFYNKSRKPADYCFLQNECCVINSVFLLLFGLFCISHEFLVSTKISLKLERTEGEPRIIIEVVVHCGQPRVDSQLHDAGGWTVNNHADCCFIRMLPLVPRKHSCVLPDKPVDDTFREKNLQRKDREAVLVRLVVELEIVVSHTNETVVIVPHSRLHVSCVSCDRDVQQALRGLPHLHHQPVPGSLGLPLITRSPTTTDQGRINEVCSGKVRLLIIPHIKLVRRVACKVHNSGVNMLKRENGLCPSNIPSIVKYQDYGEVCRVSIAVTEELPITGCNELPASSLSFRCCSWLIIEATKWVDTECCLEGWPFLGRDESQTETGEEQSSYQHCA